MLDKALPVVFDSGALLFERLNMDRIMSMEYYLTEFILAGIHRFFIWYCVEDESNSPDGIILDASRKLVVFQNREDASMYIKLLYGDSVYNFDPLLVWLERPAKDKIDSVEFLNYWNIFSDVATSLAGERAYIDDNIEVTIYDKLFWGSNLPAVTQPRKHYIPTWTDDELRRLFSVLDYGMKLFRSILPYD